MNKLWAYWKGLNLPWRGDVMDISLTYRCNLDCFYCVAQLGKRGIPKVKESTLEEWKGFIKNYPKKIKQIVISGGEPTLCSYMPELVNWLIKNRYNVVLVTNMFKWKEILKIKPSRLFKISSACHWSDDFDRWQNAYSNLCNIYKIEVREFIRQRLSYSTLYGLQTSVNDPALNIQQDVVSPDFRVYKSCAEHIKDRGNRC